MVPTVQGAWDTFILLPSAGETGAQSGELISATLLTRAGRSWDTPQRRCPCMLCPPSRGRGAALSGREALLTGPECPRAVGEMEPLLYSGDRTVPPADMAFVQRSLLKGSG